MVERNVFSKFKVYCLKLMTLAAGFSFLFACPKRNKKDPAKDYSPFAGSSNVGQLYRVISDSVFQCSAWIG